MSKKGLPMMTASIAFKNLLYKQANHSQQPLRPNSNSTTPKRRLYTNIMRFNFLFNILPCLVVLQGFVAAAPIYGDSVDAGVSLDGDDGVKRHR